ALGSVTALTLRQQALVLRDGFSYAMRIEPGNKVMQVKLQTGRRLGDAVEIVQGAKPGERYVAVGAAFLADGDTVQVALASTANLEPNKATAPVSPEQAATK
ncbi:MAG: efflux transporter periplasmic adaptor subunit, partial [Polaromonas sp.]|nr:efflux transporter periplasmic adaptor subunit [Polaromonas sp.]